MVLVWRITDDLPNSPNFPPPNFPAIRYVRESIEVVYFANESLECNQLMFPANLASQIIHKKNSIK